MMGNNLKFSKRGNISPFIVLDVLKQAQELTDKGHDIYRAEAGQPPWGAPKSATDAAIKALQNSETLGYTQANGILPLREKISHLYKSRYGLNVDEERIFITMGSSGAFISSFLAVFDQNDKVLISNPCYPAYRNVLTALDIEVLEKQTSNEENWNLNPEDIVSTHKKEKLNGVLISSPANPTGAVIDEHHLENICKTCASENIWLISDEIYHGLHFVDKIHSALEFNDNTIVISSFSKYFCMTGWRIGWVIVPPFIASNLNNLLQSLFICPPAISQYAALGVFDDFEELERRKNVYKKNAEIIASRLPDMGIDEFSNVLGGFYIYANISKYSNDSMEFSQKLLKETGVAVTPGIDFDGVDGHRYIRISFTSTTARVCKMLDMIEDWLKHNNFLVAK